jgi:choline dehydrogenase
VPTFDTGFDNDAPTCFGLHQRRSLDASGRRCSTYHAFLPKNVVQQRKNLTIVLGAYVQQILFDNDATSLRAKGLLVEGKERSLFVVQAKHEIIVCGGAIVTPQLLLLRLFM